VAYGQPVIGARDGMFIGVNSDGVAGVHRGARGAFGFMLVGF